MATHPQNYTLGKGKLYFDQFAAGTQNPTGERYLGNTPGFSITNEAEVLEHFSSESGLKEKDDEVTLSASRKATFITEQIDVDNLALFFFGTSTSLTVTGATVTDELVNGGVGIIKGLYYQLGVTTNLPSGAQLLTQHTGPSTNIILKHTSGTPTYTEGADYEIDMVRARIYIIPGGTIASGTILKATYKTTTSTRERVLSGNQSIDGAFRYLADNPKGRNYHVFVPYAKVSPNGEFALKGDTWQQLPFNLSIQKLSGKSSIYIDGVAA